MKRNLLMSIAVLVISLVFVSGVMAGPKPAATPAASAPVTAAPAQKTSWEKGSGVIEKVDEAKKEVIVQAPKEKMTFSAAEQTKISEVSAKLPFSDLKKGMSVTVEYKKEGNKLVAQWIDVTKRVEAKKETTAEVKKVNPSEKAAEKK